MPEPDDASAKPPRGFSLATATFVVVSSMVGSGILTTSGLTVGAVGSNAVMLGLWVVGGVVALCGALSLAELSASLPKSGGEYPILAEAYGPLAAFLAGWVSLMLGFAGPIAATAWAASRYLLDATPWGEGVSPVVLRLVATLAIVGFAAVHATGRGRAARVQAAITLATIAGLAGFAVAGVAAGWGHRANLLDLEGRHPNVVLHAVFSLAYVAYAYTGWNGASYLAGEVADPGRLPRAIAIGTVLVIALYVAVNLAYALALPAAEIRALYEEGKAGREAVTPVARVAAVRLFGPQAARGLSLGFALILLASLSALELTGPRVAYAMAVGGHLPASVGRLSGPGRTPAVATALLAAAALLLLWTGGFEQIVVFSSVGLSLFSLLTISSVFVLRRSRPDLPRPFRTPLYPAVPAFYLIATTALVVAAFVQEPATSILALVGVLAGVPLHDLASLGRRRA